MTSPDPAAILAQINAAREQTYQNIATAQGILAQANAAASAAAQDRAAIQAIAQQTVRVDTSVGTRVFAGDTMIFGDTGWRDLSADFTPYGWSWSGHTRYGAYIRRVGITVYLKVIGDYTHGHQYGSFLSPLMATGFAADGPTSRRYYTLGYGYPVGLTATPVPVSTLSNGSQLQWTSSVGTETRQTHLNLVWTAAEGWPPSLPGTPIV